MAFYVGFSALKGSGYCKSSSQQRQGLSACHERTLWCFHSLWHDVEALMSAHVYLAHTQHTRTHSCFLYRFQAYLLIFGFGLFAATALGGAV